MTTPRWLLPAVWSAIIVIGGMTVVDVSGVLRAGELQQLPLPAPAPVIVNVWDYMRSAISLLALAALAWTLFRSKTSTILREELDAQRARADRLLAERDDQKAALIVLNTELAATKARTDLTEVLKSQQELLALKQTHDAAILKTLGDIATRGEQQYKDAMETLGKTLNYLAESARATTTANTENRQVLDRVLQLVERRWREDRDDLKAERRTHES